MNKLPTVKIKGKEYVEVKHRLQYLSQNNKNYSIVTEYDFIESLKMFIVKATLTLNSNTYTGHSQAVVGSSPINTTSALENAETSAVGRACAMAGIGIINNVASYDEIKKVELNKKAQESIKTNNEIRNIAQNWISNILPKKLSTLKSESQMKDSVQKEAILKEFKKAYVKLQNFPDLQKQMIEAYEGISKNNLIAIQ